MNWNAPAAHSVRFIIAHALSAFGFEFLVFVLTVHVYDLTGSAWNVGLFTALTFVPRLFSPYYGSLVDRYRRERVFSGAALAIALAGLLIGAARSVPATYAGWFVISVLAMILMNVRSAIMTEIVPTGNYLRGNSIMLISLNAAKLLGPLLGGFAVLRWSADRRMYAAAGIYATTALFGLVTTVPPASGRASRSSREVIAHMREGAAYLLSSRDLRYLGAVAFLWRLSLALQVPLFVVYVNEFLGWGTGGYGIFMTAVAAGSILGSAIGPRLAAWANPRKIVLGGLVAHYASFGFIGLTRSFAVAVAVAVASFLIFYATIVSTHALRDRATPIEYRGRVYGCITGVLTPAALMSILVGSWLASIVGADKVLIGASVLAISGLVMVQLRLARATEVGETALASNVGAGP